jgi:hypothetical protein
MYEEFPQEHITTYSQQAGDHAALLWLEDGQELPPDE